MRSGGTTKGRTRDRERRGPGQLLAPAHHGASQLTAQPAQLARSGRQVLLLRCIYVSFIIVWLEPGSWRGPSVRSAAGTAHVRGDATWMMAPVLLYLLVLYGMSRSAYGQS